MPSTITFCSACVEGIIDFTKRGGLQKTTDRLLWTGWLHMALISKKQQQQQQKIVLVKQKMWCIKTLTSRKASACSGLTGLSGDMTAQPHCRNRLRRVNARSRWLGFSQSRHIESRSCMCSPNSVHYTHMHTSEQRHTRNGWRKHKQVGMDEEKTSTVHTSHLQFFKPIQFFHNVWARLKDKADRPMEQSLNKINMMFST